MRIFVGVPLPPAIKDYLQGTFGGVMGARWQTAEQMHITLRFIGEVDGAGTRDIAAELSRAGTSPFTAELDGIGLFGKMTEPRILWAGLKPRKAFLHLHEKIDRVVMAAGIEPDHRKFSPHITLARFSGGGRYAGKPKGLEMYLGTYGGVGGHGFAVEEFILYQSHRGQAGAIYEPLQHYPLIG
jgi:2'-5' RNA ligase